MTRKVLAAVVGAAKHSVHGEGVAIGRSGDSADGDRGQGNDDCARERATSLVEVQTVLFHRTGRGVRPQLFRYAGSARC